ncbi:MAG: PASTA domain-containing protein [bacterium]
MELTKKDPPARTPGGHTTRYIVVALAVVAVIVVIVVMASAGSRNRVKVPEFVGRPFAEAAADAGALGLALREELSRPDDSAPAGVILGQEQAAGTLVKKDDTVRVTVSKGPVKVVPELAGFKREDAAVELPRSGLVPGKVTTERTTEYPPGRIVRMDPPAGTELMRGQPVNLVISTAPPPPPVPLSFARPAIELTSVEATDAGGDGFTLAVGLAATNPNLVPGRIRAFYYKLEVDTFYLASAKHACDVELPPGRAAASVLSVNIRHDRLGRAAAALVAHGRVSYRVRGYYTLEAEGGRSVEPVQVTGVFDVADRLAAYTGRARQ